MQLDDEGMKTGCGDCSSKAGLCGISRLPRSETCRFADGNYLRKFPHVEIIIHFRAAFFGKNIAKGSLMRQLGSSACF